MTRSAALSAAILAASVGVHSSIAHPESSTGTRSTSARFDVRVVVASIVHAASVHQLSNLRIRGEDIARGYVDLNSATQVLLSSNDPRGYSIAVTFDPTLLSRVQVSVTGQTFEADSSGTVFGVVAATRRAAPIDIGYRLFLSKRAIEGVYPWPVRVEFRPAF
jgi:hypothetical protein